MPFGSTRQVKNEESKSFDPVYLDIKAGKRIIRIIGNEISYKVYWLDVNVTSGNSVTKARRPIVAAVLRDGSFVGHEDENWYENPYQAHLATLAEDEQKKLYAKTRFVVNVYDRSLVIKTAKGIVYAGLDGKFVVSDEYKDVKPEPHNKVMLLEGSSGKVGGKHLLQEIVNVNDLLIDLDTTKASTVNDSDIILVTRGTGIETSRSINPAMNQSPLEIDQSELYDLETFVKPWPHAAIKDAMNGVEYGLIRDEYKLPAYPKKFSKVPF